jgi:hypothetical protein
MSNIEIKVWMHKTLTLKTLMVLLFVVFSFKTLAAPDQVMELDAEDKEIANIIKGAQNKKTIGGEGTSLEGAEDTNSDFLLILPEQKNRRPLTPVQSMRNAYEALRRIF